MSHRSTAAGLHSCKAAMSKAEDTPILDKVTSFNTNSLGNLEQVTGKKVLKVFYSWSGSLGETHRGGLKGDEGREVTVGQLNPRATATGSVMRDTWSVPQTQNPWSRCYSRKGPGPTESPFCTMHGISMTSAAPSPVVTREASRRTGTVSLNF